MNDQHFQRKKLEDEFEEKLATGDVEPGSPQALQKMIPPDHARLSNSAIASPPLTIGVGRPARSGMVT